MVSVTGSDPVRKGGAGNSRADPFLGISVGKFRLISGDFVDGDHLRLMVSEKVEDLLAYVD